MAQRITMEQAEQLTEKIMAAHGGHPMTFIVETGESLFPIILSRVPDSAEERSELAKQVGASLRAKHGVGPAQVQQVFLISEGWLRRMNEGAADTEEPVEIVMVAQRSLTDGHCALRVRRMLRLQDGSFDRLGEALPMQAGTMRLTLLDAFVEGFWHDGQV